MSRWKAEIDSLNSPEEKVNFLEELLEYAILQRFPQLTLKEVHKLIQLTPPVKIIESTETLKGLFRQALKTESMQEFNRAKGRMLRFLSRRYMLPI